MFIDHFYFKLLLKQKESMDPVHYMGSMDLVHHMGSMDLVQISVPWTSPKWGVHVLSSPPDKYLGRWAHLESLIKSQVPQAHE